MRREEDYGLVRELVSPDQGVVEKAFEALYLKFRDRVYNSCYRILGDAASASDATQETFITVLRKARRFDFRSAFSSWLYRVAVNVAIDARRKRGRHRPLSLSEPEVATWVGEGDRRSSPVETPEAVACRSELSVAIHAAVSGLNPRLSSIVVLRYVDGLGYEEIADSLQMPLGTVKSRLNRAHAALETQLRDVVRSYT